MIVYFFVLAGLTRISATTVTLSDENGGVVLLETTVAGRFSSFNKNKDSIRPQPLSRCKPVAEIGACSLHFKNLNRYYRDNDLQFNLPFICYKFPLAEHSEAD